MNTNCEPIVLVEENNFCIAQCKKCRRIGLSFNNILIGFNLKDFVAFSRSLLQLDFDRCSMLFPDGQQHIVINTCHYDIQCSFKQDEFQKLKKGLTEALILLEVEEVLTKRHQ